MKRPFLDSAERYALKYGSDFVSLKYNIGKVTRDIIKVIEPVMLPIINLIQNIIK